MNEYEFSNLGRFKRCSTNKVLKQTIYSGDVVTCLKFNGEKKRKRIRICRIIAELFVPNNNPKCNIIIHKDGNGLNNIYNNLKWSTTKETVEIAFKNRKRVSSWEVLTDEQIIAIRTEFDCSEITMSELAVKYNTSHLNISSILYYKSRCFINPERPYKINQLKGEELYDFLKIKTIRVNKLKLKKKKDKIIAQYSISANILEKIAFDYVNTILSIKQLSVKYKLKYNSLKYNFKTICLPSITPNDDEIFKQINENTYISNHGRATIDGKLTDKKRFKTINGSKGIRFLVGELFISKNNVNDLELLSIDGNIKNIHYSNLIWVSPIKPIYIDKTCMVLVNGVLQPLNDVKDIIIKEYLESTEYVDFIKKYLIGYTPLFQLLRPYMKQKRDGKRYCETCGETNIRYFYKSRISACKLCISDGTAGKRKKLDTKKNRVISLVKSVYKNNKQLTYKLSSTKSRAKMKNWDFDLDEKFIKGLYDKQNGKCAYSGTELSLEEKADDKESFSIDRVDSSKGYTKDNVKLITGYINRMKLNWTYDDFLSVIKDIYEHNSLQNFPKKNFWKSPPYK